MSSAPVVTSQTAAAGAGVLCAKLLQIDATQAPDAGAGADSAAANRAYGEVVLPHLEAALGSAPAELVEPLSALLPVFESARRGEALPVDDRSFNGAVATYEAWAHAHCGYQNVELMAMDYEFQGNPPSLRPGPTSFSLMNHSERDEFHSAVLIRRKDGEDIGLKELFQVPVEELTGYGDLVPGSAGAEPAATSGMLVDLRPGHYFLICALQSDENDPSSSHLLRGMLAEFDVG